ncbi:MAG: glucose-1-dehydrogenase [Deltaproteobacteria bacterium]|nr:glucose-1-dehydrogenase [Deltaproteobacteria bacterium]
MSRLQGKIALVTGAATGSGRAMAQRFAAEGADVVVGDINDDELEVTAELVRGCGRRAPLRHCDVARVDDVRQLVATAVTELGGLDIAVANAGIVESDTDCLRMTEAQWDRTITVNLKGAFFTLQAAAQQMIQQGRGGRLIATASILAEWGSPLGPAYAASKGGLRQVVKSFAMSCGPYRITCNAIAPGFTETPMIRAVMADPARLAYLVDRTPAGRLGQPADMASVAAFLASDDAGFVTGTMLVADGGMTAGLYSAAAYGVTPKATAAG